MGGYKPGNRFGGGIATDLGNMDGDWDVNGTSMAGDGNTKTMTRSFSNEAEHSDDVEIPGSLDESFPCSQLTNIPAPSLTYDFRMCVIMNLQIDVGAGPLGERKWISFQGGSWSASFGSGTVMPGGQDIQILSPDLHVRVQTNYLLQTQDEPPAYIKATMTGWRTAPQDTIESLVDPARAEPVPTTAYKFRLFVELETGDKRYKDKINYGMWIGSGTSKGREVFYDAYRVG